MPANFLYVDPVLEVEKAAKTLGFQPSAIRELLDSVSQDAIAGRWLHDSDGNPFYQEVAGGKTLSVAEFVGKVDMDKPHYRFGYGDNREQVDDLLERAFGATPTAEARGEFVKLYGEISYREHLKLWGCDHGLKKAGVKPETAAAEKKPAPKEGLANNPWSDRFSGSEEQRNAKIAFVISRGSKFANSLAVAAGTVIGRPLPLRKR
jgi:hypothetical protein